jgi:putative PIN family toxin of toxin-antitoxin system
MFGGNPLRLLEMALNSEVELFISDEILEETSRVLRDKFCLPPERLSESVQYIEACTIRVNAAKRIDVIKDDPDDNRILECAQAADCQSIITGDSHLLRLSKFGEIQILTVRSFLDRSAK